MNALEKKRIRKSPKFIVFMRRSQSLKGVYLSKELFVWDLLLAVDVEHNA
jgi:hypothetical protein